MHQIPINYCLKIFFLFSLFFFLFFFFMSWNSLYHLILKTVRFIKVTFLSFSLQLQRSFSLSWKLRLAWTQDLCLKGKHQVSQESYHTEVTSKILSPELVARMAGIGDGWVTKVPDSGCLSQNRDWGEYTSALKKTEHLLRHKNTSLCL